MGCSKSIAFYPAKIPHFFENLKILAFYAILLRTPLIACEPFTEALLSGFQRFVCRLARPSNRWLKRPTPNASRRFPPFKSSTAARSCFLRPLSVGRFASLRFRPKNMAHHIFQLESELQNIPEAAPKASRSFSVSEKLARYGSSALSGVEHLRLLVGKDSIADVLLRHFGSLKALSRASFKELRQFLPKGKAEAVMAALSISNVADAEHALSAPLHNAEAIYRANLDMKGFHQEVVRVVLLDAQHRCITRVDIARGTVNESLARPREIFRPAIVHCAYGFVLVHN